MKSTAKARATFEETYPLYAFAPMVSIAIRLSRVLARMRSVPAKLPGTAGAKPAY